MGDPMEYDPELDGVVDEDSLVAYIDRREALAGVRLFEAVADLKDRLNAVEPPKWEELQKQKNVTPTYYNHTYKGIKLDPYRVAKVWGITEHPQFHAWKKISRAHLENHKTLIENIDEAIQCLERWKQMIEEGE